MAASYAKELLESLAQGCARETDVVVIRGILCYPCSMKTSTLIFSLIGVVMACSGTAASGQIEPVSSVIQRSWQKTLVVGHRGAAAYSPENTLPSFQVAIDSGAVATECDVHLSRDGVIMVMHDKTLDRTTSLSGPVAQTPASVMQAAGIPTLDELADFTKDRIILVVEIKDGDGIERMVAGMLRSKGMVDQSIVFSFGGDRVRRVKSWNPSQYAVWLVGTAQPEENLPALLQNIRRHKADAVGFPYPNVTPKLVEALHAENIPVFVWTVAPGAEVDRLKSLGVNFIITDHPTDVIRQLDGNRG